MQADIHPVALEIRNLSFRYDGQSAPVFSNLNTSIKPGEIVAIIGPSGSGKITLVKVLCGLFVPESGRRYGYQVAGCQ
jgi:ATP-binding cassette subfamily B protein RaxB